MSGSSSLDDSHDWTDPGVAPVTGLPGMSLVRPAGTRRPSFAGTPLSFTTTIAVLASILALAAVTGVVPLAAARSGLLLVALAAASAMLVRRVRRPGAGARRVVVVGSHGTVWTYTASAGSDLVVGAVLSGPVDGSVPGLPFPTTTSLESLPGLLSDVDAEAVLVLTAAGGSGSVLELAASRAGTAPATRVGDRLGAAALLILSSPLLLLLWMAVRLDTPGSGFHGSTRIGRDGRPFRMLSLRTLREDAGPLTDVFGEQADEVATGNVTFLIRRDPRVTRVGYWLRRWSLDELPALLNVLRGEMPLGGPPPAHPAE